MTLSDFIKGNVVAAEHEGTLLQETLFFFFCLITAFSCAGMLHHALGIVLAIIFPVIFAILRLLFSRHSMNWYWLSTV